MTASIPKQDPNTQKVQKNAVYEDKIQHANFQSNPLYQATKQQSNGKKWDGELSHVFGWAMLFSCPVFCPNKRCSFECFMCLDHITDKIQN